MPESRSFKINDSCQTKDQVFVNLLLLIYSLYFEGLKRIVILKPFAALRGIDFKLYNKIYVTW
jgi:hypothetical protein